MRQLLEGHTVTVNSIAFSADGQWIASGSSDDTVRVWSAESGECQQMLDKHGNAIHVVKFLDDGTLIAASADQVISFNSSEDLIYHYSTGHHGRRVVVVSFSLSCDGKLKALGHNDGISIYCRLTTLETGRRSRDIQPG